MTLRCAVIGNPIGHSLSPLIHQYFAEQVGLSLTYTKIQGDDQWFEEQVKCFFNQGGKGLNITAPYKERAFAMALLKTPRCQQALSANTLWMKDGQLLADNTDGAGLINDLKRSIDLTNKQLLICGAGGAARGIIMPLFEAKAAKITLVNRTLEKAQRLLTDFPFIHCVAANAIESSIDVIINATSANFEGKTWVFPESLMATKPFCYDLAYAVDEPTAFVSYAIQYDCPSMDGLGMLVEQAAEAFFIWHGVRPETTEVLNRIRPQ